MPDKRRDSTVMILICCIVAAGPGFAQSTSEGEQIRQQIAALQADQQRIDEQQRRAAESLRALEQRLVALLGDGSRAAQAPAAHSPAGGLLIKGHDSKLTVTGDLRLRGQGDYGDVNAKARNSSQIRGRLGATYRATDRVTVGARLATGDAEDPNSTDVTLSSFDDDLQVSLDQAYLQYSVGDLKLLGGKIPQPFLRTDLVWDADVNPQGLAANYRYGLRNGGGLRANALFFLVDEQSAGPDSTMLGGQLAYDSPLAGAWSYDVALAYYDYRLSSTAGADVGDFRSNLLRPDGTYLSDFNLADLILGGTWTGLGARWPVRVVGDYVRNLGARTNADSGFGVDLIFGRASKPGDWRLTYGYAQAATDAVLTAFSHDNTSLGSNYRMHALTLDYMLTSKAQITGTWYHYSPREQASVVSEDWIERLRLFFLVSF